jgi:hypothetical protein
MSNLGVMRGLFGALAFANVAIAALAGAQSPQDIGAQLKACASIEGPAESLACFKQLARRPVSSPIAPSAAPIAAAAPPTSQPSPIKPKESFGLYAAEHPSAPKAESSHTAKIIELGTSSSGHSTVTLEGGGLWELDAADPLLADGNSVIITRGAFGSFLLRTPTGRTHRVQRIR